MRYHLDTTFLIDWRKSNPDIAALREEITAGAHKVSIDPIVQTEFFAAPRLDRTYEGVHGAVLGLGTLLPLPSEAAMLAASWLAPMDRAQRRARFADALIAAIAHLDGATLVTSDTKIEGVFPVPVLLY